MIADLLYLVPMSNSISLSFASIVSSAESGQAHASDAEHLLIVRLHASTPHGSQKSYNRHHSVREKSFERDRHGSRLCVVLW